MKQLRIRLLVPLLIATGVQVMHPVAAREHRKLALFIAGPKSHGIGQHEHEGGCEMLVRHLNASRRDLHAEVSKGWPADPAKLAAADTVVIFSDGRNAHAAAGKVPALREWHAAGKGLVLLHWALEPADADMAAFFDEAVGGRYKQGQSVNPIWLLQGPILSKHPVTNGVLPFRIRDEFYHRLVFREGVTPLLQAQPPQTDPGATDREHEAETLAWALESSNGARGFGFTGGHFHRNWSEPSFRKLVLNAVVWTAKLELPPEGVGGITDSPKTATIDDAIAKGDPEEVKLHLTFDPWRARLSGKSDARTPLETALLLNENGIVALLLEAGADPNPRPSARRSPLHIAVDRGNIASVKALLAAGAHPDEGDQHGWTPLHHAAARDKVEIAKVLLERGARTSALSKAGGTPLHEAAAGAGEAMIRLLLDHKADPRIRSREGTTAFDIAARHRNAAAIRLLSGN